MSVSQVSHCQPVICRTLRRKTEETSHEGRYPPCRPPAAARRPALLPAGSTSRTRVAPRRSWSAQAAVTAAAAPVAPSRRRQARVRACGLACGPLCAVRCPREDRRGPRLTRRRANPPTPSLSLSFISIYPRAGPRRLRRRRLPRGAPPAACAQMRERRRKRMPRAPPAAKERRRERRSRGAQPACAQTC